MKKSDFTVIELFAGVGGFHLGLSESGWKVVWADQWEPGKKSQHAYECYERHFPGVCVNEDITNVKVEDIPNATLLVGGFPCQDYSVATSNAHGIEGRKGVLWWEILRILREKRETGAAIPYVILENVDRLIKSPAKQRGRDFGIILSCLDELGYVAEWRVINASDYGYPQKRRRTFIFATLVKETIERLYPNTSVAGTVTSKGFFATEFPCKKWGHSSGRSKDLSHDLVWMTKKFHFDFQNAGYAKEGKAFTVRVDPVFRSERPSAKGTLGSVLEEFDERYLIPVEWIGDPKDKGKGEYRKTWRYCKGEKDEDRRHRNGHRYQYKEGAIPFPDKLDEPSRTMLTSEGNRKPNRISHIIPVDQRRNLYRVLTPVEAEKLNGFPREWTAGMPENWRYFCMGNALVVGVIQQMGHRLIGLMKNVDQANPHLIVSKSDRKEYIGPLERSIERAVRTKKMS